MILLGRISKMTVAADQPPGEAPAGRLLAAARDAATI